MCEVAQRKEGFLTSQTSFGMTVACNCVRRGGGKTKSKASGIEGLSYRWGYWYSASMRRVPDSSKAVAKDLDFLIRISPNCFSWERATACSLTISRTARKATIMAWREGQASKN